MTGGRLILTKRRTRRAFTLIEMLVAMALTVFVMVILSEAFVKGLSTFSGLKAIGDMQENLRVATNNLRGDLAPDHFDAKRRVSDPHLWTDRPRNGFFAIYQGAPVGEGTVDNITSFRATNNVLHMTVKRKGNRLEDFFSARMPAAFAGLKTDIFNAPIDATLRDPSTFKSQWAEVAYFLVRTGTTVDAADATGNTGLPVHNLYRLELVMVTDNEAVNALNLTSGGGYESFAWYMDAGGKVKFTSPGDSAGTGKRGFSIANAAAPVSANSYVPRATLVMSDVISFHVQALVHVPYQQATLSNGSRSYIGNFDITPGFKDLAGSMFDTANIYKETVNIDNTTTAQVEAVLKGVSITIRGWDRGNAQARQTTIIQDL